MEIHDGTLREGEQTPGIVFSVEDKTNITRKLDEVGVDRIEAGMPAVAAGAELVHSCGNGLGERTANAALEELMLGLHLL